MAENNKSESQKDIVNSINEIKQETIIDTANTKET